MSNIGTRLPVRTEAGRQLTQEITRFAVLSAPLVRLTVEQWADVAAAVERGILAIENEVRAAERERLAVRIEAGAWDADVFRPAVERAMAAATLAERDRIRTAAAALVDAVLDRPFADPDDDAAKAARALQRLLRTGNPVPPGPQEPGVSRGEPLSKVAVEALAETFCFLDSHEHTVEEPACKSSRRRADSVLVALCVNDGRREAVGRWLLRKYRDAGPRVRGGG